MEGERKPKVDKSSVVFEAQRIPPELEQNAFAPFESFADDDECVYPVPDSQPTLLHLSPSFNTRPFLFNGIVRKVPAIILVDSGASASFVSEQWCRQHNIKPVSTNIYGSLADKTSFRITGKLTFVTVSLGGFRTVHDFYVASLPGLEVVLGLDFLEKHDPKIRWNKRLMEIQDPRPGNDNVYTIKAASRDALPSIETNCIELCTMQDFANMCASKECLKDEVFVGFVRATDPDSEHDEHLYSGKGATDPRVKSVLSDFADVLVSKLPDGLPPERFGVDGKPIEHCIDLDPNTKPFASQPRRLTPDEDAEIQRVLKELLASGWITPSLSPHAAPVVFVRKKPDPVTGTRALRMCVSYIKLNRNTLNKIAYRLPRIATLLDQVSTASYFTKLDLVSGYWQVPCVLKTFP